MIEVATAVDANYLSYLAVMAGTLAANRARHSRVRLTIMHAGISRSDQEHVASGAPGIDMRWVSVTPEVWVRNQYPTPALGPTYFRCLLADVYSKATERAIYLDADIVVRGDLGELWSTDLARMPIAAVQDSLPRIRDAIAPWRRLGLRGDDPYFNAGVLVADLRAWRAEGAGRSAVLRSMNGGRYLLAQGQWHQGDQYGLNLVFHQRWKPLDPTWNYFSERPYCDARVVHFLGGGKPESKTCRPEFAREFRKALERTYWRALSGDEQAQ